MLVLSEQAIGKTPKLQRVCAQLCEMARELGPDAKMPTAIALRDAMGVSMATLNTALGELEKRQIITRRHGVGIFVSPQLGCQTVALLCDSAFLRGGAPSPFYELLFDAARERAARANEAIEFHFSQPHGLLEGHLQRALAEDLASARVQGVIGVGLQVETARWLEQKNVPFVSFFGPAFGPRAVQISFDGAQVLRQGARALRARGCERIAVWELADSSEAAPLWDELQAMGAEKKRHLHFPRSRANETASRATSEAEIGYAAAKRVFGDVRQSWPDGVVINDDCMARGVLKALHALQIEVGRDVQIATHANKGSIVLEGVREPLTRLEFDPQEAVEAIFSHLEKLMRGQGQHAQIVLQPTVKQTP